MLVQVTCWEGIFFGGVLARHFRKTKFWKQIVIGFIFGGGFELINILWLHLWDFPAKVIQVSGSMINTVCLGMVNVTDTNAILAVILGVITILWALYIPVTIMVAKLFSGARQTSAPDLTN